MRTECLNEVARAIGRRITAVEAKNIEDRLLDTQRRLASRDPASWRAMSQADRMRAAAAAIGKDIEAAAVLKEKRAALAVQAAARHVPEVEAAGKRGFKVIARKLQEAEIYIKGTARESFRQILDTMDYATKFDGNPIRWISNLETPANTLAFVREVFGRDTGDVQAKGAAKAWLAGGEELRNRFNAAGGDTRKLNYSYLPQPHDAVRVREAGLGKWVRTTRGMIDRSRYFDELGRQLDDHQITTMLETAWRTIQSDGLVDLVPGAPRGKGALAGKHAEARELHFAGPDEYVKYLGEFGHGSVFDALQSHIGRWSRDIGLVETFGPNPEHVFQTMHDTALKAGGTDRVAVLFDTKDMWKTLTGELSNPQSQTAARIGQGLRNMEVIGKLQQTTVTSITDLPTYFRTLGFNRLSFWQGTVNLVRAFGKDSKRYADLAGLVADSKITDMNRWSDGMLGRGFTTRVSSATMKVSFLDAWTNALRRGLSITLMHGMAKLSEKPWERLDKFDRARLLEKGWTPEEWAVVHQTAPETWRKTAMMTPASIKAMQGVDESMKQRAISRLLATIVDESEFGSINPDLRARTFAGGGMQRGTGKGELWRCVTLFKSFPISMMTRHWDRMLHSEALTPAGRVLYGATLFPSLTLFGGLSLAIGDLLAGKDPRDMFGGGDSARTAKFWLAAFLKGGGAGFVGDMLLSGVGRQGQSGASAAVGSLAGPVVGSGFELLYDVGFQNLQKAAEGDDTHGKEAAMRWVRGHTPFVNLWYSKLVLDQAFLNDLQEMIAPGYLDRVKERAYKQWHQDFWWSPGGGEPRAPNLEAAVGQ
ncbi:MAG: hypothetical protein ACR2GP_14585 [Burkholderiaceae bacterium]